MRPGAAPAAALMGRARLALIALALCAAPVAAPRAQTLSFQRFPGLVGQVLDQFRQSDHHIAEGMNENLDGERIGRRTPEGFPPMNFDPSAHLQWVVTDLNGDGRPEVLLLVSSMNFCGNFECPLLIFTQRARRWHLVCETEAWADVPIRLMPRRRAGWREFLAYGRVTWRRNAAEPAGAECVERDPGHPDEWRRQYDRRGFPIPWPEIQRRRGLNPDGTPLGTPFDDPVHREWEAAVRAARRL